MRPSQLIVALVLASGLSLGGWSVAARAAEGSSGPDAKELQDVLDKAYKYLREHQAQDGSFSAKFAGPGVSALVVAASLRNSLPADDALVAKTLGFKMPRVLFPRADGRFVGEIRNRDSKTVGAANTFCPEATGLLESQFEHGLRHLLVPVIALRAP